LEVTLLNVLTDGKPTIVKVKFSQNLQSKTFEELMSLMRVAADEEQAEGEDDDFITRIEDLKQIPFKSVDNEINAWKLLDHLITDRLKEYPTTIV